MNRQDILQQLRAKRERGEPIIGGGAGTGISAKCEEAGGIDLIVIYNSGRYRMAGRGSLAGLMAYSNASVPVPWSACLRKSPLPRRYSSLCKFAISHETENPRHRNL